MSHIKTFARLKPAFGLFDEYEIKNQQVFSLRVPEHLRDYGLVTPKGRVSIVNYDFEFERVFDTSASQEEVYTAVAKEIVAGFLEGYNGTIFAYGQTGTGKTYTVEGGALRYSDRGLAPRALTQIYKSLEKRENEDITLHISYLEIYQEVAYDLLGTSARTASPVTVFPRVNVLEGASGTCSIQNLSLHLAPSEDVAHAILLQDQTNRKVAVTPVNQRSSRSHAVFTIYLMAKQVQSDIITRSKLHLVDLAGSERVAKTGVDGQQLTEAKSINLSLHHLETVIIALQSDISIGRPRSCNSVNRINISLGSRPSSAEGIHRHVPYRNSLLTMVLKDSLGGNCLTSMIATISLEVHNLGETLSTCRFALRVACIANHARRNEELDDKTLIQHLKRQVTELEAQMACLRLSQSNESDRVDDDMNSKLTDEDKLICAQVVQKYLAGNISDPVSAGITSPFKFRECLRILKTMVMNKYFHPAATSDTHNAPASHIERHRTGTNERARDNSAIANNTNSAATSQSSVFSVSSVNTTADSDDLQFSVQKVHTTKAKDQKIYQQKILQDDSTSAIKTTMTRGVYKSPFERKREKEIQKLSHKMDQLKKAQSVQEQDLQALHITTASGELICLEAVIRNKIQVTREQIADQHAYCLHLRHTEADPETLRQEKLVQDQLIKREAKFQKKLDEVLQKKEELESQAMQDHPKAKEKQSLDGQFSQYKRRNGTLNTRQVFALLLSEKKKQRKAAQKTEAEKKVLMTKQLAIKEEATREKLRELKDVLRKSRDRPIEHHFDLASTSDNGTLCSGMFFPDHDGQDKQNCQVIDLEKGESHQTVVEEKASEGNSESTHLNEPGILNGDDLKKNLPKKNRIEIDFQNKTLPDNLHCQSRLCNSHTTNNPKVEIKWDSAYSRLTTPYSQYSQNGIQPRQQRCSDSRSNNFSHVNIGGNSSRMPLKVAVSGKEEERNGIKGSSDQSCGQKTLSSNFLDLEECKSFSKRDDLSCAGKDMKTFQANNLPTVMPSEYVHSVESKDKFDARKMGLSCKTFDSALSSMLSDDSKAIYYGFEFYDKYARESKPPVKKNALTCSVVKTRRIICPEESEKCTAASPDVKTDLSEGYASVQGPESKNCSQFLSDDKDRGSANSSTELTLTTKGMSFLERLTQLQEEEILEDKKMNSPRIQALKDPQRERSYMSHIQAEKERVAKIRQARSAAEVIQRAWRHHCSTSQ